MTDHFADTIRTETARVLGITQAEVEAIWDEPLDDEAEDMIVESAAATLGCDAGRPYANMPAPMAVTGSVALRGLQSLAPFSDRAAKALREATYRYPLATPASLAASFREGRFVPSGLESEQVHQPIHPTTQIAATMLVVAGGASAFALFNWIGCNPVCRACDSLGMTFLTGTLPVVAGLAALFHGLTIGAGLWHLGRNPVARMAQ